MKPHSIAPQSPCKSPDPGKCLQMSISTEFWKKYVIVGTLKSKNHLLFYFSPRNEMHSLSIVAHSADIWVGLYKVLNKLFAKVSSI